MFIPEDQKSLEALVGTELSMALQRSVGTSLASLTSLREVLFEYTRYEKMRGLPLEMIIGSIVTLVATAENTRPYQQGADIFRDHQLARQLASWCREDYSIT